MHPYRGKKYPKLCYNFFFLFFTLERGKGRGAERILSRLHADAGIIHADAGINPMTLGS